MTDFDLRCGSRSNVGRQRENNEDRVICHLDRGIFAVIDGVGGEVGGERAAAITEEHLLLRLSRPTGTTEQVLEQAIVLANREILTQATGDPALRGMSCVLTAVVLEQHGNAIEAVYGHVGDTRLYRLFPQGIEKLTRDHSFVGELEDRGELTEEEAMRHPRRNEILRDVGSSEHNLGDPEFVDVKRFIFRPTEALLLCSDGLSDQVSSQQIRAIVERSACDPQTAVDKLIAAANEAGGKDNVSVVLVVGPEYPPGRSAGAGGRAAGLHAQTTAPAPAETDRPAGSQDRRDRHAARASSRLTTFAAGLRRHLPRRSLLVVLTVLALIWVWPRFLAPWLEARLASRTLEVGPSAPFEAIQAALDAARSGDRIVVRPGTYRERLRLKDGVALESSAPRRANLSPAGGAEAVLADGVRGVTFEGFRIELPPEIGIGIRLIASDLVVRDVEISGAQDAAIFVLGGDRSTIERCFLHDNPGAGVSLGPGSSPWLVDNVVSRTSWGTGKDRYAVEAQVGAALRLRGNVFAENGSPVICAVSPGDPSELFLGNRFRGLTQEQAVRLGAAVCGPAAP